MVATQHGTAFGTALSIPHDLFVNQLPPQSLVYDYDNDGRVDLTTVGATNPQNTDRRVRSYYFSDGQLRHDFVAERPLEWFPPLVFVSLFKNSVEFPPSFASMLLHYHPSILQFHRIGDTTPLRQRMTAADATTASLLNIVENSDHRTQFRDLDNDGVAEVLYYAPSNPALPNGGYILTELTGNGTQSTATARLANLAGAGKCSVWADFTGDGLVDVINLLDENRSGRLDSDDGTLARSVLRFDGRRFADAVTLLPIDRSFPGCNPDYSQSDRAKSVGAAGFHVVDWNGDGQADLLVLGRIHSNPP